MIPQHFYRIQWLLLGYSFQHAARFEDEGGKDNATEVSAGPKLRDDVPEDYDMVSVRELLFNALRRLDRGSKQTISLFRLHDAAIVFHVSIDGGFAA